ncbi:MAG: PilZ domain-containing protein [Betaproteobacteria bacterium]|nr:PilZ domain-containing protein [Betaproteobacteria bacterium]
MEEQRQHPRYPARWPCAIIFDHDPAHNYHGHTHDLSQGGAAILSDYNVPSHGPFTLLLSVPPIQSGVRPMVLEIRCHMAYSVHSHRHSCFRHGAQFVGFNGSTRQQLAQALNERFIPR